MEENAHLVREAAQGQEWAGNEEADRPRDVRPAEVQLLRGTVTAPVHSATKTSE